MLYLHYIARQLHAIANIEPFKGCVTKPMHDEKLCYVVIVKKTNGSK